MQDLIYNLISTSWFKQLKNGKVLKFEVFYLWMSIGALLVGIGVGHDGKISRGVEFSTFYYVFISVMVIGWILRASTFFGWFKASKEIQDKYWQTQLMRFMDPSHAIQREIYTAVHGSWENRLKVLKPMWYNKYDQTVEYTRANAPWILKARNQILFLPLAAIIGVAIGYFTA